MAFYRKYYIKNMLKMLLIRYKSEYKIYYNTFFINYYSGQLHYVYTVEKYLYIIIKYYNTL